MFMSSRNIAILASATVWIFLISWVIYLSCVDVHAPREGSKPLISMNIGSNLSEKELEFEENARRELIGGSNFISIDCGIENDNDYTDSESVISYTSDVQYVESGVNMKISDEFLSETQNYQKLLSTVRSFPEGNSSCYTLKPTTNGGGNKYLIRAFFMYGNYDSKSQPPVFKLYLNANEWDEVKLDNASQILIKEVIHNPPTDYIHVCLVNVGSGTPIISALEIRELNNTIYETAYNDSLILYRRLDEGASSTSNKFQRYKDDFYDRIWEVPDYRLDWETINTTSYVSEHFRDNHYKPSPIVMSTAVSPVQGTSLALSQNVDRNQQFYLYMYFLEVENLPSNATREFNIYVNNKIWYRRVVPDSGPTTIYSTYSVGGADSLLFSINMTDDSTVPPILNAVEYYIAKKFPILPTNQSDETPVEAMISIRSNYGVKKNWQGDPCVPAELRWDGLDCNANDQGVYRIISVNLSFSWLMGEIQCSFSKLDSLQSLDLSHNTLTGTIPDFLANMPSLTTINLSGNKLEGSVPASLLDKVNNSRALVLSLDGNPDLCLPGPCKKKKAHNQRLPVVIAVPITSCLVVMLMGVVIFKCRKKATSTKGACDELKKEQGLGGTIAEPRKEQLLKPKGIMFKCTEIIKITSTFRTVIGRGGSGVVYLGCLEDGSNVAVKMLSSSSAICGQKHFLSEMEILIKIHHTNLVSFVGYCAEGATMALVYEYMANGNLGQHLSENNIDPLSWKQRVHIALDAVQGLEYLHNGCKPPIIHRDLKSANILLNQKLQAKLADFGLSRIFASESDTHVTTTVAGTAGYLDPEYSYTLQFNEKSDVYSLGIVLLELITGKPAIIKDTDGINIHIVDWVNKRVEGGDIHEIMDQKLQGKFNINSAWKFLEAAMACTMAMAIQRMSAIELLVELKQCLAIELAEEIASRTPDFPQDVCLEIDTAPSAR